MIISSAQIRAARGLINFSQRELAEKADLSLNSLNNIERDVASPRDDTLWRIRYALEAEGVEFIGKDGVRLRGEEFDIKVLDGDNLLEKFYSDILSRVINEHDEVLYLGVDNDRFDHSEADNILLYRDFERELIKRGVGERLLFLEGDTGFISLRNVYRWVSEELFGQIPLAIYGDNVAIILWGPPRRMLLIRNASIAETFRRQFNAIWNAAIPVPDDIYQENLINPEDAE